MTDLRIGDFDAFFREVHGPCGECEQRGLAAHECIHIEPFAWQRDLVAQVCSEGWPSTIELPTASGKTAVIDIAIFTLALDATPSGRAPLRVFFVVDRRVVVDEAYRRASRIAGRLSRASSGTTRVIADRLRALAGGGDAAPLMAAMLRGGIYREDGWARHPLQPLVVISTVDQVGSRLLGRGYGVSDEMKPLHQGLVAHDSLIILDEAHLSEPFRQTLEALHDYAQQAEVRLPRPYEVLVMSATPRSGAGRHFKLQADHPDLTDRRPGRLLQRLETHKWAELRPVLDLGKRPAKAEPQSKHRAWAEDRAKRDSLFCNEVASSVRGLIGRLRCVGVVVNRVGTARTIFELLRGDDSFDAVLLTGRSRPMDREAAIANIWPRARAGRTRGTDERPLVVVATQCVEAGADLDFDGLVTECASLDALRQRFGRLDRLGGLGESRGIIIARSDTLDDDPVYGRAIGETWKWLWRQATKPRRRRGTLAPGDVPRIDFGQAHFPNPTPPELEKMLAPPREAPVLLPAHLDAWAMTSPRPVSDPDVALWLHGVSDEAADLQIVWRSDLPQGRPQLWADIVALCPPGSAEALPLPVYAARSWLAQMATPEVADTIASSEDALSTEVAESEGRRALRWCGEDDPRTDLVWADKVRPGDTLVVPAAWGGADEYGWLPEGPAAPGPVEDLGDRVQLEQRGRATLRICTVVSDAWVPSTSPSYPDLRQLVREIGSEVEEDGDAPDVDGILDRLSGIGDAPPWICEAARRLRADGRRRVDAHPFGGLVVRSARRSPYRAPAAEPESDFTTQDNTSSFVSRPIGLRCHSLGVEDLAKKFGRGCGLHPGLVADLALSGWLHDIGKADPRFQRWLYGGDEVASVLFGLRAKSGMQSRSLRERARVVAGYPKGGRHELLSVAMIQPEKDDLGADDIELVLHLIASHHGFCRPFLPYINDPDDVVAEIDAGIVGRPFRASTRSAAQLMRLDSGMPERFWRMLRRFGWLGLPYLESILRLADHRQSDSEEKEEQAQ
jgi:CRISPR-associated endonuclease/helicase Cas3